MVATARSWPCRIAGRTWLRVLAENVDADEVTAVYLPRPDVGCDPTWRVRPHCKHQTHGCPVPCGWRRILSWSSLFRRRPQRNQPECPPAPRPATGGLAIRSRTRSRRATATGHALSRHWRLFIAGEDGQAPVARMRQHSGAGFGRGDVVDAASMLAESLTADERALTTGRLGQRFRGSRADVRMSRLCRGSLSVTIGVTFRDHANAHLPRLILSEHDAVVGGVHALQRV